MPRVLRVMRTPIGELVFEATQEGLCRLSFGSQTNVREVTEEDSLKPLSRAEAILAKAFTAVDLYLRGEGLELSLPLAHEWSPFQAKVLKEVSEMPYGEVRSYEAVAEALGSRRWVRPVGRALATNPLCLVVPCHRVIAKSGDLDGFADGLAAKEFLLQLESEQIREYSRARMGGDHEVGGSALKAF